MKDTLEAGFLFPADQEKHAGDREKERRSRIYGTPEFWFAYAQYIRSPAWRKLCEFVKNRARNQCERSQPSFFCNGRLSVHHLTYDRFMQENLSDLQLLCDAHHEIADRERERQMRDAYEAAGEAAMDAAGMNTYFTKKYGSDWAERFGNHIESFYEEWEDWKHRKSVEDPRYD
jgi:hypothetical protein